MMKRIIAVLMLLALTVVFVGCGSQVQSGIDQFAEMLEKGGIKKQTKLLTPAMRTSQFNNALKMYRVRVRNRSSVLLLKTRLTLKRKSNHFIIFNQLIIRFNAPLGAFFFCVPLFRSLCYTTSTS